MKKAAITLFKFQMYDNLRKHKPFSGVIRHNILVSLITNCEVSGIKLDPTQMAMAMAIRKCHLAKVPDAGAHE